MRNGALIFFGLFSITVAAANAQLRLGSDAAINSAVGAIDRPIDQPIERPLLGPTDAELTLRVHGELNQHLKATGVTAEIVDGVATLRGTVATEKERDDAAQIARRVDGVTRVKNEIVVNAAAAAERTNGKPATSGNTRVALDAAVGANLAADKKLADNEIGVRSDESTITLTGEVSTQAEKDLAGRIAAKTAGVAAVRNRIIVHAD